MATYTTLDESVWSVPLAWAFDLVSDVLSPEEHQKVVERLLIPAAEHLVKRHYGHVLNFSCWHSGAIATLARVSNRPDLLERAILISALEARHDPSRDIFPEPAIAVQHNDRCS